MTPTRARELTERVVACGVDLTGWTDAGEPHRSGPWLIDEFDLDLNFVRLIGPHGDEDQVLTDEVCIDFNDDGANLGRLVKVVRERWAPERIQVRTPWHSEPWEIGVMLVSLMGPGDSRPMQILLVAEAEIEAWVAALEAAGRKDD